MQNCVSMESSLRHDVPKLKKAVRQTIHEKFKEDLDVTWKSYIYSVPKGVMSFAMRASTNILATADNLKRWNRRTSDHCQLCKEENAPF